MKPSPTPAELGNGRGMFAQMQRGKAYLIATEPFRQGGGEGKAATLEDKKAAIAAHNERLDTLGFPVKAGMEFSDMERPKRKGGVSYKVTSKGVAIIPVIGVLSRYSEFDYWTWSWSAGMMDMIADIAAANYDPNVKAILLWMDSPGGTVDGTEELANAVWTSAKPVDAMVAGSCFSACYWVASQCRKIYSTASTNEVGSIGVLMQHHDWSKAYEEMGLTVTILTSSGSVDKVVAPESEPLSDEDKAKVTAELDALRQVFRAHVTRGRSKALEGGSISLSQDVWAAGRFTSTQGRANGLIDGIRFNYADIEADTAKAGNASMKDKNKNSMGNLLSKMFGSKGTAGASAQGGGENTEGEAFVNAVQIVAEAEVAVAKAEGERDTIKAQMETLSLKLATAENDAKALATVHATAIEAKDTEIGALNAKVAELTTALAEAKTGGEGNTTALAEATQRVEALTAANTELEAKVTSLTNEANTSLRQAGRKPLGSAKDASDTRQADGAVVAKSEKKLQSFLEQH